MELDKKPININITSGTVIRLILILSLLYLLYLIRDILIIFFVALIFSTAIDPWVDRLKRRGIPKVVGLLLIYLVLLTVIGLVIYLIIPPIILEVRDLSGNLPNYLHSQNNLFSNFSDRFNIKTNFLENIVSNLNLNSGSLGSAFGSVFSVILLIFGGLISFILILVLIFYMVVEENAVKKLIWSLAPKKNQVYIIDLVNRMQEKIGLWLSGQLILMLIIFLMVYFGLTILGVKYALLLALIAGLLEFIPYLGPILGAVPGVFLAFTQAPWLAVFTALMYYIVQLLENNLLVPKIMQKAVGLNPIISMLVLLVGFQIGGIIGAIISLPVATALSVLIYDIFSFKEKAENEISKNI